jgi:hypothetical protein
VIKKGNIKQWSQKLELKANFNTKSCVTLGRGKLFYVLQLFRIKIVKSCWYLHRNVKGISTSVRFSHRDAMPIIQFTYIKYTNDFQCVDRVHVSALHGGPYAVCCV